jgi:predicted amidohydrolase YtcJ
MRKTASILLWGAALAFISACSSHPKADMVISGGSIYTADANQSMVESVAIVDGLIVFAGSAKDVEKWIGKSTEVVDLKGATMTPGFIESHGHFMGLGYNELNIDLMQVTSYEEMVELVRAAAEKLGPGQWITGRGWHQSKWTTQPDVLVEGFQTHDLLSAATPNNPVFLRHASGHAGFANAKAMEIAGVNQLALESLAKEMEGGEILRDALGNPTGIFSEPQAMNLITRHIPETTPETDRQAFELAVAACHRHGITSFHDAGIDRATIEFYHSMQKEGKMGIRMYGMLTGWDRQLLEEWYQRGPLVDPEHFFTIRSIKLNCDGALGNRGAWLLEPYTDRPDHHGHETVPMEFVAETSSKALKAGFQVCSHAIGDRANREILDRYQKAFETNAAQATNHRFRIEHAQHLHPEDIPRFGQMGVIAAMQAIHMASDRPWAIDRLGEKRIVEGAYVWQTLLQTGAKVINGTDVPVEPIDPLASFYASVTRKTLKGQPEGGYEPSQRMSREQALLSYTLDAAFGAFEEDIKGSITVGKLADFTVFDKNIMTVEEDEILDTHVVMTIIGGEVVFRK